MISSIDLMDLKLIEMARDQHFQSSNVPKSLPMVFEDIDKAEYLMEITGWI